MTLSLSICWWGRVSCACVCRTHVCVYVRFECVCVCVMHLKIWRVNAAGCRGGGRNTYPGKKERTGWSFDRYLSPGPGGLYSCMYVYKDKDSAAPTHARTRAHRPAAPRQRPEVCIYARNSPAGVHTSTSTGGGACLYVYVCMCMNM